MDETIVRVLQQLAHVGLARLRINVELLEYLTDFTAIGDLEAMGALVLEENRVMFVLIPTPEVIEAVRNELDRVTLLRDAGQPVTVGKIIADGDSVATQQLH